MRAFRSYHVDCRLVQHPSSSPISLSSEFESSGVSSVGRFSAQEAGARSGYQSRTTSRKGLYTPSVIAVPWLTPRVLTWANRWVLPLAGGPDPAPSFCSPRSERGRRSLLFGLV